jgi:thymidylate synthase (FAD)
MNVIVEWSTPNAEELVAKMARVSNPANENNKESAPKLLKYLIDNKHWSPFEMVNVCMQIETTRDIARQILRHRSFSFQEFSQRYAEAYEWERCEVRMQDVKNRQSSMASDDKELARWWSDEQTTLLHSATKLYKNALNAGIAKEVARKVLPEGMTTSRMYMNGTLRSWLHYVTIRCDKATQKEHREVAEACKAELIKLFPSLKEALNAE